MTELLFLVVAINVIVAFVLLTGGGRVVRPRLRELDEARDRAIRGIHASRDEAMRGIDEDVRRIRRE